MIKDFSKQCGLKSSPKDYRDIPMGATLTPEQTTIPEEFMVEQPLTYTDQGQLPECVAFSGSTINQFLQAVLGVTIQFDPQWLYAQCKLIDGIPGLQGTTFRAMLKILNTIGCMPLGGNPADLATIAKYKIAGYVQVPTDFQSIKTAIFNYGVILCGFVGSNEGWQTEFVRPPHAGESTWQHATSGKGYNPITVVDQNSWGQGWGDNGNFYFGKDYPPFECWAALNNLPANWETLLPQINNKPKYNFTKILTFGCDNLLDVKALQDCLRWLGCFPQEQSSTGFFGQITLAGVKLYQGRMGIPQTGNVAVLTMAALNKEFNN